MEDILIEEKILKMKTLRIKDFLETPKADQKEDMIEIMEKKVNLIIVKKNIPVLEDNKATNRALKKQWTVLVLAKILRISYLNQTHNLLKMCITLKETQIRDTQDSAKVSALPLLLLDQLLG